MLNVMPVAALYVERGGCYFGLPGVDPWDLRRDARAYPGPWPVVAHPPCARWSCLARLVESREDALPLLPGFTHGRSVGEDGGTFASALAAVRRWGGVLEHPARTLAWAAHDLPRPRADWLATACGGWVCEVAQGAYGHRAPKLTWLYYVGEAPPPPLDWSRPGSQSEQRRRPGGVEMQSKAERIKTPPAFRELLLSLARGAHVWRPGWTSWVPCDCCENQWCVMHERHAFECSCPGLDEEAA